MNGFRRHEAVGHQWLLQGSPIEELHLLKHPVHNTDVEVNMFIELGAEPVDVDLGFCQSDCANPQPAFQQAIINAVQRVTQIAPADDRAEIIGTPVVAHGVIHCAMKELDLCASITGARYTCTTEFYPDCPHATPDLCNAARVTPVRCWQGWSLRWPSVALVSPVAPRLRLSQPGTARQSLAANHQQLPGDCKGR